MTAGGRTRLSAAPRVALHRTAMASILGVAGCVLIAAWAGTAVEAIGAVAALCIAASTALAAWLTWQLVAQGLLAAQELTSQADVAQARQREDSQRAAVLAPLAAGLAHELGQPLSAARVGIEGLHFLRQLGREPDAAHVERTLAQVGQSLIAMTATIEHLRLLASNEHRPIEVVNLSAVVEAVLAERGQWLRFADTRIEWSPPIIAATGLGDTAGVRLILTNLLRNAVEAVAAQTQERRLVRVTSTGTSISVHDSGPGLDPAMRAALFDPFASTKGPQRGIGLSLAKVSADRMGATLDVASTPGLGCSFTLSLRRGAG